MKLKLSYPKKMILVVFCFSVIAFSQEFKKNATAGFVFLELPVNARGAALGEASISLNDLNSSGIFSNPASVGFSNLTHSFSTSYSPWIADIKQYSTSYSYKSDFGSLSLGVIAVDYGTMIRTQKISGQRVYEKLGEFSASAISLGVSYSKMLTDRFSFGVTGKYVKETIDVFSADNFLFDGGVLYFTGLSSLRIGATIQNFGVDSKYLNDPFKMPSVLRIGAAAEIFGDFDSDYRVTLISEMVHPNDGDEKLNTGIELSWKNMVVLRGGYKFFYDEESYSFGIGLNPDIYIPMGIDFAFASYGRLGNILRFSLQLGIL